MLHMCVFPCTDYSDALPLTVFLALVPPTLRGPAVAFVKQRQGLLVVLGGQRRLRELSVDLPQILAGPELQGPTV